MKKTYFFFLIILIASWLPAQNAGDRDDSFGVFGADIYSRTSFVDDYGRSIIAMDNGKFVIAGESDGFFIIRLQENGNYDTSFGSSGKLHFGGDYDCSGCTGVWDIEELNDGKLLLVGSVLTASNGIDIAVMRLLETGTLDPTFGDSGVSYLNAGTGIDSDRAYDLHLLDNGKILVAGGLTQNGMTNPIIFRLLPDGDIDQDFGTNGYATTSFGAGMTGSILSMAVDQDDRIWASSTVYNSNNSYPEIGIIRFLSDGTIDSSFGDNGTATSGINMTHGSSSSSMILKPDGSSISVGYRDSTGILLSFDENGSLNTDFGNVGVLSFTLNSNSTFGRAIVAHPNGKFLVTGSTVIDALHTGVFIARFNNDGTFDNSFGDSGWNYAIVSESISGGRDIAYQYDGKILIGGSSFTPIGDSDFMAARFYSGLLGTSSEQLMTDIKLVPNPSDGLFNIVGSNGFYKGIQKIEVYDQTGRLVQSFTDLQLTENSSELDLRKLSTGTYFVRLSLADSSITEKIIKE